MQVHQIDTPPLGSGQAEYEGVAIFSFDSPATAAEMLRAPQYVDHVTPDEPSLQDLPETDSSPARKRCSPVGRVPTATVTPPTPSGTCSTAPPASNSCSSSTWTATPAGRARRTPSWATTCALSGTPATGRAPRSTKPTRRSSAPANCGGSRSPRSNRPKADPGAGRAHRPSRTRDHDAGRLGTLPALRPPGGAAKPSRPTQPPPSLSDLTHRPLHGDRPSGGDALLPVGVPIASAWPPGPAGTVRLELPSAV